MYVYIYAYIYMNIYISKIVKASILRGRTVGGQREALHPWQKPWGRRLDIRKGGIEPQESPLEILEQLPP